ncbi:MAG: PDZ domain-containing protein [Alphaproteobacteria bacterium]|nr:PDZ domain-containing protein [Alphaproteobacteria bacterium]
MRMCGWYGRVGAVLLAVLMSAGCADVYQAQRSTDVYTASDYDQPKPMASVDDAIKVFDDLETFYSSGDGFKIDKLMADRTGVRFHESRTVTEQRTENTVYNNGGLFSEDQTATTYKNVDVAQDHDAWIPADKIAGIAVYKNFVGFVYSDETFYGLQASDNAVARKLADAFATLQAANYGPSSKFCPVSGIHLRVFPDASEQPMAAEYDRLGWDRQTGVLVDGVDPGSSAAAAGIVADDIIFEANGKPVSFDYGGVPSWSLVRIYEAELSNGQSATFDLKIFRNGQITSAKLTLTNPIIGHTAELAAVAKPAAAVTPAAEAAKPSFGISARDLTAGEAKASGVSGGVYVGSVTEGSPAAKLGLQQGDYLLEIDGTKLTNLEAIKPLLAAGTVTSAVVWRMGKIVTLGGLSNL